MCAVVLQGGTDPRNGHTVYVHYESQFAEAPAGKAGDAPAHGTSAAALELDSTAAAAALGIGKRAATGKGSKSGAKASKSAAGPSGGAGAAAKKGGKGSATTGAAPKKASKTGKRKAPVRVPQWFPYRQKKNRIFRSISGSGL